MFAWLVTLHVLGVALFLVTHGVSMWTAFRVRRETNRDILAALLGMSARSNQVMYLGLILLGVGGLGAAGNAGWLTTGWVVASYAVFLGVLLAMFTIASPYYYRLREGLEGTEKTPRLEDDELRERLQTRRPEVLAMIGGGGLTILIWLMTARPG